MLGHIDDVKHQIALIFASAAFLAVLSALDDDKADGLTTPAPAEIKECEIANPQIFPHCQIIGGFTEFDQESSAVEGTHQLQVVWLHVGDDEATVTKVIERYVSATRAALWNTTFSGAINAGPTRILREDYSELAPGPQTAFLKGGRTFVAVPTVLQ